LSKLRPSKEELRHRLFEVYSTPSTTSRRNFQQRIINIIVIEMSHSTVGVMHHDDYHADPAGLVVETE
jgi:hypothetical protein